MCLSSLKTTLLVTRTITLMQVILDSRWVPYMKYDIESLGYKIPRKLRTYLMYGPFSQARLRTEYGYF